MTRPNNVIFDLKFMRLWDRSVIHDGEGRLWRNDSLPAASQHVTGAPERRGPCSCDMWATRNLTLLSPPLPARIYKPRGRPLINRLGSTPRLPLDARLPGDSGVPRKHQRWESEKEDCAKEREIEGGKGVGGCWIWHVSPRWPTPLTPHWSCLVGTSHWFT